LFSNDLISEAEYSAVKTALEVGEASFESAGHGVSQARASLERAEKELNKTTIIAPIDGTVVLLRSEQGERVVGTSLMSGTEIMTVAQLDQMEARVEVGEVDVVLIEVGQKVRLEADAFRDDKFTGVVTEIANASNNAAMSNASASMGASQEATKFQVKIRVNETAGFRPGMSVTSYIETRSAKDVLAVPLQSVTTRAAAKPKADKDEDEGPKKKKKEDVKKVEEVVFLVEGDRVKKHGVESGIRDDDYVEIKSGLEEGQTVVSGSYRAISRDLKDDALIDTSSNTDEKEKP
jgi:HlyD family secretion protein